jgi:HEAT repeat protein
MAVEYLGRLQSRHPQALEFYTRALQVDDPSASQESDAVLLQVCQALAGFVTLSPVDVTWAEAILLAALAPAGEKGFLRRFTKTSRRHSESVQAAVCEALAEVGTPAAVPHLRRIAETDKSPVAKKAAAAARQIQERSFRKAPSPGPS